MLRYEQYALSKSDIAADYEINQQHNVTLRATDGGLSMISHSQ